MLVEARTELTGTVGRIYVEGQLGHYAGALVTPAVQRLLGDGATTIEVHTAGVTTADPDGIAALVNVQREATDGGASFALVDPSAAVSQLIAYVQRSMRKRSVEPPDNPRP